MDRTITLPMEIVSGALSLIRSMTWMCDKETGEVDRGLMLNYSKWVEVADKLEKAIDDAEGESNGSNM